MIEVRQLEIPGLLEIVPRRYEDPRGFFSETFNQGEFAARGIDLSWIQDNHAYSGRRGILRGLHFQRPPFAQAKLIRVSRGSVLDVAVDIRAGSPTFGRWLALELSADRWNQLYVPAGFAHGYLTLGEAEVLYKVSAPYAPQYEQTIRFDDPVIAVEWPLLAAELIVSDKDRHGGSLADATGIFQWNGA